MKYLYLFENFQDYKIEKINDFEYNFIDTVGNNYVVNLNGPFNYIFYEEREINTGVTYDLDFITQDKDYKKLTNAGQPFSISNIIFGDILKDFLNNNYADTINIDSGEPEEDIVRYEDKIMTRYHLYLRSLRRNFKDSDWEVKDLSERKILLINKNSKFWKKSHIFLQER